MLLLAVVIYDVWLWFRIRRAKEQFQSLSEEERRVVEANLRRAQPGARGAKLGVSPIHLVTVSLLHVLLVLALLGLVLWR